MNDKTYEIVMTRDEFNTLCEADEDGRPIMDLRNRLMDMIKADGQDPEMYDGIFRDEDPVRMTAVYNERRAKKSEGG